MPRRIVIGILVVSLVAPGTAVPHFHSEIAVPADHDKRPHSHVRQSWLFALLFEDDAHAHDSDHGHSHANDGSDTHRHTPDDNADSVPAREEQRDPVSDEGHDADALYVSGTVVTTKTARWSDNRFTLTSPDLSAHLHVYDRPHVPRMPTPESLPPPTGRYACPTYLQIRTLLI